MWLLDWLYWLTLGSFPVIGKKYSFYRENTKLSKKLQEFLGREQEASCTVLQHKNNELKKQQDKMNPFQEKMNPFLLFIFVRILCSQVSTYAAFLPLSNWNLNSLIVDHVIVNLGEHNAFPAPKERPFRFPKKDLLVSQRKTFLFLELTKVEAYLDINKNSV